MEGERRMEDGGERGAVNYTHLVSMIFSKCALKIELK